jgi:hypothetical protein
MGAHPGSPGPVDVREAPFDHGAPPDERPEFLVLDIGGDQGALVVYATEECLGTEIDLTRVGEAHSHRTHTMIRRRRAVAQQFVAGVYPQLPAGIYTLWARDGQPLGEVTITGGTVSQFDAGDCRPRC